MTPVPFWLFEKLFFLLPVLFGVLLALVLSRVMRIPPQTGAEPGGGGVAAVRIIATPPGEAPEAVRDAWVGLVLPLAVPGRRRVRGAGVLTGPRGALRTWLWLRAGRGTDEDSYCVESAAACALLARAHPEAARWWQKNAPQYLAPGHCFLFAASCCRETEAPVWPPPPADPAAGVARVE